MAERHISGELLGQLTVVFLLPAAAAVNDHELQIADEFEGHRLLDLMFAFEPQPDDDSRGLVDALMDNWAGVSATAPLVTWAR